MKRVCGEGTMSERVIAPRRDRIDKRNRGLVTQYTREITKDRKNIVIKGVTRAPLAILVFSRRESLFLSFFLSRRTNYRRGRFA